MALNQHYVTKIDFQDVYAPAGRTRAAIRGFIKYSLAYEKGPRNKGIPEWQPLNL